MCPNLEELCRKGCCCGSVHRIRDCAGCPVASPVTVKVGSRARNRRGACHCCPQRTRRSFPQISILVLPAAGYRRTPPSLAFACSVLSAADDNPIFRVWTSDSLAHFRPPGTSTSPLLCRLFSPWDAPRSAFPGADGKSATCQTFYDPLCIFFLPRYPHSLKHPRTTVT